MAGVHHREGACVWREPCVACPIPLPVRKTIFFELWASEPEPREKQKPNVGTLDVYRRRGVVGGGEGSVRFDEMRRKLKQISNLSVCCGIESGDEERVGGTGL